MTARAFHRFALCSIPTCGTICEVCYLQVNTGVMETAARCPDSLCPPCLSAGATIMLHMTNHDILYTAAVCMHDGGNVHMQARRVRTHTRRVAEPLWLGSLVDEGSHVILKLPPPTSNVKPSQSCCPTSPVRPTTCPRQPATTRESAPSPSGRFFPSLNTRNSNPILGKEQQAWRRSVSGSLGGPGGSTAPGPAALASTELELWYVSITPSCVA